jgi:hypothetical protein
MIDVDNKLPDRSTDGKVDVCDFLIRCHGNFQLGEGRNKLQLTEEEEGS